MKVLTFLPKVFLPLFVIGILVSQLSVGPWMEAREPAKDPDRPREGTVQGNPPAQTAAPTGETRVEPAGKPRPDWWLTFKTKMALLANPDVSAFDINVDTKNGVIYLKGTVSSENEKRRAEEITHGIEGKVGVVNDLVVSETARREFTADKDESIQAAVEKRLAENPAFDKVNVAVKDGIVTLTGAVETYELSTEAARLARVNGVRAIQNELRVEKEPPS